MRTDFYAIDAASLGEPDFHRTAMLQMIHTHAGVRTLAQFQRLSPVAQQQYVRATETREPRQEGVDVLTHALRCFAIPWCAGDAYRVVNRDAPETALYDVWLIDDASDGLVFVANTTTETGVEMSWSLPEFVVAHHFDDRDGSALRLATALNDAERVARSDAPLLLEHPRDALWTSRLVGFVSSTDAPTSPEAWDALFADRYLLVSEDFVRRYGASFGPGSWRHVWQSAKRSEAFIREFARTPADWKNIYDPEWREMWLSEELIRENAAHVNWAVLGVGLSEPFMREFRERLNWVTLSRHAVMSEPFIREFQDRVSWPNVSWFQVLSEPFIEEFSARISFVELSRSQTARSIAFLRRHEAQMDWRYLAGAAPNLEELIEAFPNRVPWSSFALRPLSTAFIEQHVERFDWSVLQSNLTEEQARRFADRVDWVTLACQRWEPWVEALLRENAHRIDDDALSTLLHEGRISLQCKNELRARRARMRGR